MPADSPSPSSSDVSANAPTASSKAPGKAQAKKPGKRKSRKRYNQVMKVIRRVHLYTGLLLLPWVLLFGISGFFFNHPGGFPSPSRTALTLNGQQVAEATGYQAQPADALAQAVIEQLNANDGGRYTLLEGAHFSGLYSLQGQAGDDSVRAKLDLATGVLTVEATPRGDEETSEPAELPFADATVNVDGLDSLEGAAEGLHRLIKDNGVSLNSPLTTPRRGGVPNLQFKVEDTDGRAWHVVYNPTAGSFSGRAADEPTLTGFRQIVTRLHKLHHYPDQFGARYVWAIAGDATALTMVFWGISGAIMWWQMKPTRLLGTFALSAALVAGFVIFTSTLEAIDFGGSARRGGPGAGPGAGQGAGPAAAQNAGERGEGETGARGFDQRGRGGALAGEGEGMRRRGRRGSESPEATGPTATETTPENQAPTSDVATPDNGSQTAPDQ